MPRIVRSIVALLVLGVSGGGLQAEEMDKMKEFAERYTAAWSSQDPARVAAHFAEDGALTVNEGEPISGRDAITEFARGFMTSLPDMVLLFDGLEPLGERIRYHWTLIGTDSGPSGSGNQVHISGHESWLMSPDGLIADSRGHYDADEYDRQLRNAE